MEERGPSSDGDGDERVLVLVLGEFAGVGDVRLAKRTSLMLEEEEEEEEEDEEEREVVDAVRPSSMGMRSTGSGLTALPPPSEEREEEMFERDTSLL